MSYLATCFLQNTAILIHDEAFQLHPLFNQEIFQKSEYKSFAASLWASEEILRARSIKTTAFLEEASPEICNLISSQKVEISTLKNEVHQMNSKIDDLISHVIFMNNPATQALSNHLMSLRNVSPSANPSVQSISVPMSPYFLAQSS